MENLAILCLLSEDQILSLTLIEINYISLFLFLSNIWMHMSNYYRKKHNDNLKIEWNDVSYQPDCQLYFSTISTEAPNTHLINVALLLS